MARRRALHNWTIYSTKGIILPCYYLECVDVCGVVVAVRCFCASDHCRMAQKLISQRADNSTDKKRRLPYTESAGRRGLRVEPASGPTG